MDGTVNLTGRQMQVVGGLDRGKTQAHIAEEMGVTVEAVKQHTRVLRVKLKVERAREIPHAARQAGLL